MAGQPMGRASRFVPRLLFVAVVLVYLANGRTIGSGDTLPARYLPFSLLRAHDANLDEFPELHDEAARSVFPLLDGVPYFLHYRGGHYLSAYSPGPAVLALPVYAGPVLAGASPSAWAARLEKLAAAAITALSVVCLFMALEGLVALPWALGIALVYAFGTSSWSVSSQALWQHGPSQLFLSLLLLCLVRGRNDERWLAWAGFAASSAAVMRSTDALVGLPVLAWLIYTHRRLAWRLILFAVPPMAALALYHAWYFGAIGPSGNTTAPAWAFFAGAPSLEGFWGVLASPGRGVFVYSPVLVFAIAGLLVGVRREPLPLIPLALGVTLVVVVVSQWFRWWGGYSWGPRLLADVTPILCFFLYPLAGVLDRRRVVKAAFIVLAALSIGAHGLGAFFYDSRWDVLVDVDRNSAPLWSWTRGPLAFYGRRIASSLGVIGADSPERLAASYRFGPRDSIAAPVSSDLERVLGGPLGGDAPLPTATISTDRPSYGRGDTVQLTVRLGNPGRPRQFDGYLVGQGPGDAVWFHDGQRLARRADNSWVVWSRRLPMPARATGRFALAASTLGPGAYRWHVVMTEADTFRVMARGATAFTVEP